MYVRYSKWVLPNRRGVSLVFRQRRIAKNWHKFSDKSLVLCGDGIGRHKVVGYSSESRGLAL